MAAAFQSRLREQTGKPDPYKDLSERPSVPALKYEEVEQEMKLEGPGKIHPEGSGDEPERPADYSPGKPPPGFQQVQRTPRANDEWEREGWEGTWEKALPYGSNNRSKGDTLKQVPDGYEYTDQPYSPDAGMPKGSGSIFIRPKKQEPAVS